MIGQVFGRWTVREAAGRTKNYTKLWLCECECGTQKVVIAGSLLNGRSRSCGCLHRAIVSQPKASLEERLWRKIDKRGPDECWPWTAGRNKTGYGMIQAEDKSRPFLAHRVAYEFACGPIPAGMCVLHRCDNPACCNPAHLWLGTQVDNIADMNAKGRHGNVGRKMSAEAKAKRAITNKQNNSYQKIWDARRRNNPNWLAAVLRSAALARAAKQQRRAAT